MKRRFTQIARRAASLGAALFTVLFLSGAARAQQADLKPADAKPVTRPSLPKPGPWSGWSSSLPL